MRFIYIILLFISGLSISGCYDWSGGEGFAVEHDSWTGSGDYSLGSASQGMAAALAGEDVILFNRNGLYTRYNDVLSNHFDTPYRLTSIAQTSSYAFYQQTLLHGNQVGRTDNLDLFFVDGYDLYYPRRIGTGSPVYIQEGASRFYVKQICDMATADPKNRLLEPYDRDSRLFMSVRACTERGFCVGGIIEAGLNTTRTRWGIRAFSGQHHAYLRRAGGGYFPDTCMPIAATRWSDTSPSPSDPEYLFVGDPVYDEVTAFDVRAIQSGPVGSFRTPDGNSIKDITAEGMKIGNTHFSFLAVLWSGTSTNEVRHYTALDGYMSGEAFSINRIGNSISAIQSLGEGYRNYTHGYGYVYSFADVVIKTRYRAN